MAHIQPDCEFKIMFSPPTHPHEHLKARLWNKTTFDTSSPARASISTTREGEQQRTRALRMGYTHYYQVYNWDSPEWQAAWKILIQDAPIILEAADVLISGPRKVGENLTSPIVDLDQGICFTGVADDEHETFYLSKEECNGFIKTLQKPYDVAVACILLRAYVLAPKHFWLESDGTWNQFEWIRARRLYSELWAEKPPLCPWYEADHLQENRDHIFRAQNLVVYDQFISQISDALEKRELGSSSQSREDSNSSVPEFDFTPVKRWLSACEEDASHSDCKPSPIHWENASEVQLKVIDVHRRCIVHAPENCSFLALTYVWGGVNQPHLNEATAPLLMSDGGLNVIWSLIPTTIQDAIAICERLGEQYLWIDAFCIMQDSTRDMKLQMLRMRQIYSAAKCTLAAVSADTTEKGLLVYDYLSAREELKSEESLEILLGSSPWGSRAWCYQEKVLSHRIILFTAHGIFMECQKGIYSEDGTKIPRKARNDSSRFNGVGGMLSVSPSEDLESYVSAVEYYSKRKLTKQDDKINAFQGILKRYGGRINGIPSSFVYGIPIYAFDQVICWRTATHKPHLRIEEFPSWSWLGWNDAVSFDRKMLKAACTNQMIYSPSENRCEAGTEVRKPAYYSGTRQKFGFPTGMNLNFYNSNELRIYASIADLRIALHPVRSDGSNGLYAVLQTNCGPLPTPPPPKMLNLREYLIELSRIPPPKFMDAETRAAPIEPAAQQTSKEYDFHEHDLHGSCEAKEPLGYIWLDMLWRKNQSNQCIMEFMALAGVKSTSGQDWTITMLMCLQRMVKRDCHVGRQRIQIMDCEISEEKWMKARSRVSDLKLI